MAEEKPAETKVEETEDDKDDDETDTKKRVVVKSEFNEVEDDKIQITPSADSVWEPLHSVKEWNQLGLSKHLLDALAEINFKRPSKIQGVAITAILKQPYKNFIGQAQSGTGKTASFLLSMLTRVDPAISKPQILCLAPTRELARQIFEVAQKLAKYTTILFGLAIPTDKKGLPTLSQQIIIGTTGTVSLLLEKGRLASSEIKMIVLDEADEMLYKQGEDHQAIKILKKFKNPQICLFSATFNDKVKEFIHKNIPPPWVEVSVPVEKLSLEALKQMYIDCKSEDKKPDILHNLYSHITVGQSIIFTATRSKATVLKQFLKEKGHEVSLLHGGGKVYRTRDTILDSFKKGKSRILVTTNLLARGVDVLQVSLVINFDLPINVDKTPDYDSYLHRIGRSARYGKPGLAINFVHDDATRDIVKKIEEYYKSIKINEFSENQFDQLDKEMESLSKYYPTHEKK
jgi:ATP-dependent RNA helicase DDX19/DBP5